MQARYYDPVIGRFYSNDPVSYVFRNPVHSFGRYTYANNNPYRYTDPDGREGVGQRLDLRVERLGSGEITRDQYSSENMAEGLGGLAAAPIAAATMACGASGACAAAATATIATSVVSKTPKPTRHSVNQKINRNVKSSDELDAVNNPLTVKPIKVDSQGRPSQRSIGAKAEVAINPETNKIVSVNPTSSKKAERLIRQQKESQ
jgi:hypothetical protein